MRIILSLIEYLSVVKDTRSATNQKHDLVDVIFLVISAITSGCEDIGQEIGASTDKIVTGTWMIPLDKNNLKGCDLNHITYFLSIMANHLDNVSHSFYHCTAKKFNNKTGELAPYQCTFIKVEWSTLNPRGAIRRFFDF